MTTESTYLQYLPACFQQDAGAGPLLGRFLSAFEAVLTGGVELEPEIDILQPISKTNCYAAALGSDRVIALTGMIATGYEVKTWDFDTGKLLQSFPVTSAGSSPGSPFLRVIDDHRVLAANAVWDIASGRQLRALANASVNPLEAAMIGSRRMIAGQGNDVAIWDLGTGARIHTLQGHGDEVTAVAVLDERRAVSASKDSTLRLWDLDAGKSLAVLQGHTAAVNAVLALDRRHVVSSSSDRSLRLWAVEAPKPLLQSVTTPFPIYLLAWLDPHRIAASFAASPGDPKIAIWNHRQKQLLSLLETQNDFTPGIHPLGDDKLLVTVGGDGAGTGIYDVRSGDRLRDLHPYLSASGLKGIASPLDPSRLILNLLEFRGGELWGGIATLTLPEEAGLEQRIDRLPTYFDPGPYRPRAERTPEDFLPWLASWAALAVRHEWPEEAKRRFIAEAIPLYRQRGTKAGIARILDIYTGMAARIDEDPKKPHYFKVTLHYHQRDPDEVRRLSTLVRQVLDQEKPAHTYYDLDFDTPTLQVGVHSHVGQDTLIGDLTT